MRWRREWIERRFCSSFKTWAQDYTMKLDGSRFRKYFFIQNIVGIYQKRWAGLRREQNVASVRKQAFADLWADLWANLAPAFHPDGYYFTFPLLLIERRPSTRYNSWPTFPHPTRGQMDQALSWNFSKNALMPYSLPPFNWVQTIDSGLLFTLYAPWLCHKDILVPQYFVWSITTKVNTVFVEKRGNVSTHLSNSQHGFSEEGSINSGHSRRQSKQDAKN